MKRRSAEPFMSFDADLMTSRASSVSSMHAQHVDILSYVHESSGTRLFVPSMTTPSHIELGPVFRLEAPYAGVPCVLVLPACAPTCCAWASEPSPDRRLMANSMNCSNRGSLSRAAPQPSPPTPQCVPSARHQDQIVILYRLPCRTIEHLYYGWAQVGTAVALGIHSARQGQIVSVFSMR